MDVELSPNEFGERGGRRDIEQFEIRLPGGAFWHYPSQVNGI
jgi:hypothetical protein